MILPEFVPSATCDPTRSLIWLFYSSTLKILSFILSYLRMERHLFLSEDRASFVLSNMSLHTNWSRNAQAELLPTLQESFCIAFVLVHSLSESKPAYPGISLAERINMSGTYCPAPRLINACLFSWLEVTALISLKSCISILLGGYPKNFFSVRPSGRGHLDCLNCVHNFFLKMYSLVLWIVFVYKPDSVVIPSIPSLNCL